LRTYSSPSDDHPLDCLEDRIKLIGLVLVAQLHHVPDEVPGVEVQQSSHAAGILNLDLAPPSGKRWTGVEH
jgi:hypothetical protein